MRGDARVAREERQTILKPLDLLIALPNLRLELVLRGRCRLESLLTLSMREREPRVILRRGLEALLLQVLLLLDLGPVLFDLRVL